MYQKLFQGSMLPALGMGGFRFPTLEGKPKQIDRTAGQAVIDAAIRCGIRYFDTSHTYQQGDSERFLGEALSRYPRDSYYLATKFHAGFRTDIEQVFAEQLERCQTDYFDFYLLHCLSDKTFDAYTDPGRDYLGFLLKQKEAGRIRHIGFSSHASPEALERFLARYDGFDMAMIQLNYLDWTMLNGKQQYEILTRRKIPVWVMEPLKGGRLSTLNGQAAALLKQAAPERSLPAWGFRFLQGLDNVQCVLSGMSSVEQVLENTATFQQQQPLSQEEQEILFQAGGLFLQSMGVPCSSCRYCCDTCPAELDIPLLIRSYNERRISGVDWKIPGLSRAKTADACIQCGTCRTHCPQGIDIPAIMLELAGRGKEAAP